MNELLILGPLSTALAVYFVYRLRAPARHMGLVDSPGGRKLHESDTPLVGGVAVFATFVLCTLLLESSLQEYRPLFAGMGLLLITGILDDLHELAAREKFVIQLLAAVILIWWGSLQIMHLGSLPLLGHVALGWMAVPFTLLCVVGLINAVNMFDGLDGLAGGATLVMFFWLAVVATTASGATAFALPVLLVCALLGFLVFNFPWRRGPASAFMGDSGSTMLGFVLAWLAIELTFRQGTAFPPVAMAWILALPVFDTISLMARRLLKGRSPVSPDREHLHHIFLRAGFSAAATVYILVGIVFVTGAIGVGGWWLGVPQPVLWFLLLLMMVLHFLFVQHAWRAARLLRRMHPQEAESSSSE